MEQIQDMTDFRQDVDNLMLPDPLASSGLTDSTNSAFGKYIFSPFNSSCVVPSLLRIATYTSITVIKQAPSLPYHTIIPVTHQ